MSLSPEELVFRTRALAQAHPFSPGAQAYMMRIVAHERSEQAVPEIGNWAGYALTSGYCLRRVEEIDSEKTMGSVGGFEDLDSGVEALTDLIRTEGAEAYLLYEEEVVVDALDRLISGELDRRLGDLAEELDGDARAELEGFIAGWVIKGYALRVVEQLVDMTAGSS